jgi:small subunit ribosomal protein S6
LNLYEAMFLFDPTFAGSFENCENEIRRIMDRAEAQVVFLKKWEERRLAYKLKGRKRGVYVLTYFNAPPDKITGLERDARLSENILRVLVVRADGMTPELMEKAAAPRAAEPAEGDYEGRGDRGDRRPREAVGAPRGAGIDEPIPDLSNE